MSDKLFADIIPDDRMGEINIVTYRLDRSKVKSMPQLLDIFEFLLGEINLEAGMAEDMFLQAPIANYFTKVVHESEDTDESMSKLP